MSCNQDAFSCSVSSFQDSHAILGFQDSHAIFGFSGQSCYFSFLGTCSITTSCFQDTLNDCISQCQDRVFHTDPVFWTCWVTISQCQDGVFHADPVFQALVSKCQLFMVWTPQTLPSGHTKCCSLPSASSLPLAQSVSLSACLPVCPPVCQPGLNTPHPLITQYAATCHLHYVCISTVSHSVFCHTG